jgi:hypothetical protein
LMQLMPRWNLYTHRIRSGVRNHTKEKEEGGGWKRDRDRPGSNE